jgi:hypothetical protein
LIELVDMLDTVAGLERASGTAAAAHRCTWHQQVPVTSAGASAAAASQPPPTSMASQKPSPCS